MQMQEVIKYAVKAEVEAAKLEMEKEVRQEMEKEVRQEMDAAKKEAEQNMKLTKLLLDAERYEDLRRITQDKEYLRKMLEEFGID